MGRRADRSDPPYRADVIIRRSGWRRAIALIVLIAALAPGTWVRTRNLGQSDTFELTAARLPVPSRERQAPHLGPFRLEDVWRFDSDFRWFSGFSTLLIDEKGIFTSFSDRGGVMRFAPPGTAGPPATLMPVHPIGRTYDPLRDIEGAVVDDETGTVWLAAETRNTITRLEWRGNRLEQTGLVKPKAMRGWGINSGAEAFLRLDDGRFLALREATTGRGEHVRHSGLIFAGDPVASPTAEAFTVLAPAHFSPTDAAQLPDGRVLVLLRRLVWPMPPRFAGRLAIADPAGIEEGGTWRLHEVAKLSSSLPVDNFEGLAAAPRKDGRLDVWLISDANLSAFQRTLLWRMTVDPGDLPLASKKARGNATRPSAVQN